MINFTSKKIKSVEVLGDILKEKREQMEIPLEEAEKKLMIDQKYLAAFETSDYRSLPSETYALQFLKKYCVFLDLDYDKLKVFYFKEKELYAKSKFIKNTGKFEFEPTRKVSKWKFLNIPKIWRNLLIAAVILSVFVYFGFIVKKMYTPPFLTITSPENNMITQERVILVSGQTEKEVKILINNQTVLSDEKGYFNKQIDLQKGINIIKISAATKHSKENVAYREVMVE